MRLFMFMEAFEIDAYEWLFLKSYCERGIYLMEDLVWQVNIFEYFHFLIFFLPFIFNFTYRYKKFGSFN